MNIDAMAATRSIMSEPQSFQQPLEIAEINRAASRENALKYSIQARHARLDSESKQA
jgi:hypothetical protein